MNMKKYLVACAFLCIMLQCYKNVFASNVRIGVLANRGDELALQQYNPIAAFLENTLNGFDFTIVPLSFVGVDKAISSRMVDYIVLNPAFYVQLERRYGIMRIATMNNKAAGFKSMRFGGVIFTRSLNQQINSLEDIKGKRVVAVDQNSMGGWLAAYGEFVRNGITPSKDFKSLEFIGTHDGTVNAVLSGQADVGSVRTDTLEQMAESGIISLSDVKVIKHQEHGPEYDKFPFLLSTRLYPEWAVARLAHVSDDQAKKVAAALLVAPDNFFGNYNTHIYSFTVPLDYRSVDDLLRELKIDPYDKLRITSFREVLFFYRFEFSSGLLILIFSLISVFYYRSFAFRLRHAKERLLHELAERKKIEASLLNARKIADAASRAKSEFLANMSHEIRTPLNGVLGMLQLLETTDPNEEQKEYLLGAIRSTNRLTRLLSDILDISRIEAGRMEIVEAEFNIKETRDSIRELFEMEARGKGLLLEYGWNDNLPLVLIGDEPRLRQILFNLVGNALKFTEKGEVRIDASLLPGSSDSFVRVLFAVSDTGIGIADEYLKDIFEPFVQAEGSYTRRFQGAGLGLSIVRRLVSLLGGEISVDTTPGEGTTIYVSLPFKLPTVEPKSVELAGGGAPFPAVVASLRILIAEDDSVSLITAKRMLEKSGYSVTIAKDGQEALQRLVEQDFDLVLMDVQMPIMDGVEATKAIRGASNLGAKSSIPIIAMTAYAMAGDKEKFIAAGMDDYIAKPVDKAALVEVIERVLRVKEMVQ